MTLANSNNDNATVVSASTYTLPTESTLRVTQNYNFLNGGQTVTLNGI